MSLERSMSVKWGSWGSQLEGYHERSWTSDATDGKNIKLRVTKNKNRPDAQKGKKRWRLACSPGRRTISASASWITLSRVAQMCCLPRLLGKSKPRRKRSRRCTNTGPQCTRWMRYFIAYQACSQSNVQPQWGSLFPSIFFYSSVWGRWSDGLDH